LGRKKNGGRKSGFSIEYGPIFMMPQRVKFQGVAETGPGIGRFRGAGGRFWTRIWARRIPSEACSMAVGYVYFIEAESVGLVKIGWTGQPPVVRFGLIRGMSPVPLTMLGVVPGGREAEADLHREFRLDRERGEWFRVTPRLRDFIRANAQPCPPRLPGRAVRWPDQHVRQALSPACLPRWARPASVASRRVTSLPTGRGMVPGPSRMPGGRASLSRDRPCLIPGPTNDPEKNPRRPLASSPNGG
jgi:hypothetical protein